MTNKLTCTHLPQIFVVLATLFTKSGVGGGAGGGGELWWEYAIFSILGTNLAAIIWFRISFLVGKNLLLLSEGAVWYLKRSSLTYLSRWSWTSFVDWIPWLTNQWILSMTCGSTRWDSPDACNENSVANLAYQK